MDIVDISNLYNAKIDELTKRITNQKPVAGNRQQKIDKNSKLYKVSQEFEALFIKQMLDTMRKTINKAGLLDGGYAEEIFEDMLYDNYAQKMAENAGLGIADALYKQLSAYDKS